MEFVAVRCPFDNAVLFEAEVGARETSRHLCRKCGKRYTVEGREVWLRELAPRTLTRADILAS